MNTAFVKAMAAGILSVGERPSASEPKFDDPYECGRFRKPTPVPEASDGPTTPGRHHVRRGATPIVPRRKRQTNRKSKRLTKAA